MKIILTISALFGLAAATDCGKFTECTLVNLSQSPPTNVFNATGTTIVPGTVTKYDPNDSPRGGWSIKCETKGIIDYVKYFLENGDEKTHFSPPFWIRGDGDDVNGRLVNVYEDLETCGPKKINVKFYIWSQGDNDPCDTTTIELLAKCPPTMAPAKPPTMAPVNPPTMAPVNPPTKAPVVPCIPITCPENSFANIENDGCLDEPHECICVKGFYKVNGKCVRPPTMAPVKPPTKAPTKPCYPIKCPENSIANAENDGCVDSDHECVCLKGFYKFFGKCVRPPTMAPVKPPTKAPVRPCIPITCPPNSIPVAESDGCVDRDHECVCKRGYRKVLGKCVISYWYHL